jgi:hypothetical protein
MKMWQSALLVLLLGIIPLLSACDTLGLSSNKKRQQDYYNQQIEAFQKQQEANQKAQDEYNQQMQKAINDYSKQYNDWQLQQMQLQGAQIVTDNKS